MKARHAIAVGFTHTSSAPDLTIVFPSGASPVTVNVPTGTYYMWLCPLASCFLRQLAAATTAALVAAGRAETATVALSDDGVVTFAVSGSPTSLTFGSWYRRIGLDAALVAGNFFTGTRPVWYLGLMAAATGQAWQPKRAGGSEATTGGLVYTYAAANTSFTRTLSVTFQPTDPTFRAAVASEATAMYPADTYLSSLGLITAAREWSVLDNLHATLGGYPCGVAIGNWLTVKESTSEGYWSAVYVQNILNLEVTRHNEAWAAYEKFKLELVGTGTVGTRA